MENNNQPNPIQVQKFLKGVDYPATKEELIAKAKENDADEEVLAILEELPEKSYETPADVSSEIGDL